MGLLTDPNQNCKNDIIPLSSPIIFLLAFLSSLLCSGMPVDWLVYTMQSQGLEVFTQSFTCKLPFPDENKERYMVHGTNIYGILRAPRAPHTDALVLGAPCGEGNNDNQAGPCQIHWAKDTFLMNEHDLIGMQAWLEGYHHTNTNGGDWSLLQGRGGSIQAALSLEQCIDIITSLHLVLEGLNGQLPNLDLHTTNISACPFLCICLQRNDWDSTLGYIHAAQTMTVLKQASGRPWGNHGPFLRYHIETATVRGINTFRQYKTDTTTIGRLLEGIYRKLNNLLEHLHHGYYMPAFGHLAVIMLLHVSIDLWDLEDSRNFHDTILTPVVISHMTGVALYTLPILSQQMAVQHFPVSETETVVLTAIVIYTGFCLLSPSRQGQVTEQSWRMLKLVALLYLAVLLGCTALINFSLGFIVAGILDHALYDSLVYPLLALPIYPCWLLLWNILFWK
uniref:Glycosylphosphatidylinositol anchor attachment 1 n=1 Tax=Oncorhynchus kisutch TaxID=8019 RepID=A0A8C7HX06_ONCKI